MNSTLLALKDIHEPPALSDWPPAIGWWILAVAIPLLLILSIWIYKRLTRKSAVKTAKKILAKLKQDATQDNVTKVRELSVLLRRVAISLSPRDQAAGLTGLQWLVFLDSSLKNAPFSTGIGKLLIDVPYRKNPVTAQEVSQLIELCEVWLKVQPTIQYKLKS
ncbi:MAG: hypothetical protein RI893_1297, partial [Pseudomonadota bacterium]|jgi:hypothetical protein